MLWERSLSSCWPPWPTAAPPQPLGSAPGLSVAILPAATEQLCLVTSLSQLRSCSWVAVVLIALRVCSLAEGFYVMKYSDRPGKGPRLGFPANSGRKETFTHGSGVAHCMQAPTRISLIANCHFTDVQTEAQRLRHSTQ